MGVSQETVARRTSLTTGTYRRAEDGFPVKYSTAQELLQAINGLLREQGKAEVSLEDLRGFGLNFNVKIRRSVRLPGTRKTWKEVGVVCVFLCNEDEVTTYNFEAWLFSVLPQLSSLGDDSTDEVRRRCASQASL